MNRTVAIQHFPFAPAKEPVNLSMLAICHEFNTLGLMVRRRAQRAVSNHGGNFGLAAILRDALAIARRRRAWTRLRLGLLRMRSEW
jgi:hypothetical protein